MTSRSKKLAAVVVAGMLCGSFAPAASFAAPPKGAPCNSGNGNGSETDPASDCDPGNSGGHNNGGD